MTGETGTRCATRASRMTARLIAAAVMAFGLGGATIPAAHAWSCHASKTCGKNAPPPPPDYCDSGGITGASQVDQAVDGNSHLLGGIAHDPGAGGFGPVSQQVFTASRGTPVAGAGTEIACALSAPDPPFSS